MKAGALGRFLVELEPFALGDVTGVVRPVRVFLLAGSLFSRMGVN